jgi:DNA-binding NtrC family response regulator
LQRVQGEAVDLVLSDILMAGMNGIALAREMREQAPRVPVLLMSGYSDALQSAEAEFAVLRKPFDLDVLEAAIRRAVQADGPS